MKIRIEIEIKVHQDHTIIREWCTSPLSMRDTLKQYNISGKYDNTPYPLGTVVLDSEQDYILWQLYQ